MSAPELTPQPSPDRLARRRAFVEDVAWMATTGETHVGAAARLRMRPGTLSQALTRAGRPDLWRLLMTNGDPAWRGYAGPTAKPTATSTHNRSDILRRAA